MESGGDVAGKAIYETLAAEPGQEQRVGGAGGDVAPGPAPPGSVQSERGRVAVSPFHQTLNVRTRLVPGTREAEKHVMVQNHFLILQSCCDPETPPGAARLRHLHMVLTFCTPSLFSPPSWFCGDSSSDA
ncbi:unnamed protein product [Pleuronectes platessa]|uniref:Uncharacterized protein n=1 Tax=Pleuronectes platessa TaxID=8262 RepID=A0A9N7TYZ7_PLEPL|nr:unnamed protein product [Pleuronectes platessa]